MNITLRLTRKNKRGRPSLCDKKTYNVPHHIVSPTGEQSDIIQSINDYAKKHNLPIVAR